MHREGISEAFALVFLLVRLKRNLSFLIRALPYTLNMDDYVMINRLTLWGNSWAFVLLVTVLFYIVSEFA